MKIRIRNNIKEVPFGLLEQDRIRIVKSTIPSAVDKAWKEYLKSSDNWINSYGIKDFSSWIYPQLLTLLSQMKLNKDPVSGLINGSQFWIDNVDLTSDWWKGVIRFLKIDPRGLTMSEKQYTTPGTQYCSLVPIVLAAHKLYNDIPYNNWDRATLNSVVNYSLAEAMLWVPEFELHSSEELLELRNIGLTVKSGSRSGQINKAESSFKLFGIEDPAFKSIPSLAQVMLTQIWCAHPKNRTKYMVLDPFDWDAMPSPLLHCDITTPIEEIVYREENPWE